ncbi:hypothetical protein [Azohydromonas australica]|uniref:hypothetical protein n=1 Tax=Azohydromonas australica TaxID=364039 RepID=UPI0003F57A95|nr:hypothetical protein [Azohydromonas australica]
MLRQQATSPHGLKFEDLALTRDPVTGTVRFNTAPLQAICDVSGLDLVALVSRHDGVVCALIAA